MVAGAREAVQMRDENIAAFREFSVALPAESCAKWTEEVQAWEEDHDCPNPYENNQKSMSPS